MEEKKRAKIRREAKKILQNFAKKLEKVKIKEKNGVGESGGFRKEQEGAKCDSEFRQKMFENAPQTDGVCLIMEKKEWQ